MSEDTLKNIIRRTLPRAEKVASYAFQGGEPTLRGLDFFRSAVGNDKLIVFAQEMGKDNLPALIREAEHNRRMKEMRAQYERMMSSMGTMSEQELNDMFPETEELVVNTDSPLITKLEALESMGTKKEEADRLAQHIYDQAKLAHGSLDSEGLERFLKFNTELLSKSADNL